MSPSRRTTAELCPGRGDYQKDSAQDVAKSGTARQASNILLRLLQEMPQACKTSKTMNANADVFA